MRTRDFPAPAVPHFLGGPNEAPLDLSAVQADDVLLDWLGDRESDMWLARANKTLVAGRTTEADLHAVLVTGRRYVDSRPIPELVDTDEAVDWIGTTQRPPKACGEWVGFAAALLIAVAFWAVLFLVLAGVR